MTDDKLMAMIADIIECADYDLYKDIFVYTPFDEEDAKELENVRQDLLKVARRHIK